MRIEVGGSPLQDLQRLGQSVWLDCHDPRALAASQLARLVKTGVSGVVCTRTDSVDDYRRAADQLRRIYNNTGGHDGYVNVELPPDLVRDADGMEFEARRFWSVIGRPNILIGVPANEAGLIAMRRLVCAGLNVNATAIFGAHRYAEVVETYLAGLEDRIEQRAPIDRVVSVASVFVNAIDAAVDRELDQVRQPDRVVHAKRLRERTAVAVARLVYQRYKGVFTSPRWLRLATYHAQTQRLLWAGMDDGLRYVNELVGPDTIALMPPAAIEAYADHGAAAPRLERNLPDVLEVFCELERLGVDLERISTQLESASLRAAPN